MPPRLTPAARTLLRRQRGLIADWQAPDVGLSRGQLVRAARHDWSQVSPRVFSQSEEEASAGQRRFAGVLECGPQAALTGCAALVEAGWNGSERDLVDVLEPRGARRTRRPPGWLRGHQPRHEVRSAGSPRRISASWAAIDAAGWAASDREAVMILVSALQQRLFTPDGLATAARGRQCLPRVALIRDVLEDFQVGATSTHERAFLRQCRQRGLPTPRMQSRRVGRTRRTDAEFVLPSGRLLIVEIDGLGHLEAATWQADIARHNELALTTGALVLRITGWELRHDPDPFFRTLEQLLHPGW